MSKPGASACKQFHVRPATQADVPSLLRMSWQIAASLNAEMIFRATKEAYLRDGFGPNKRFSAFVAECDRKIIGMVTYSDRYSTALASPVVYVQDIFVDSEHRRGGVAKALLACVATEAVKQGSPLIELTMRDGNPAANAYRRCGFSRVPYCITFVAAGQTLVDLAGQFADVISPAVGM